MPLAAARLAAVLMLGVMLAPPCKADAIETESAALADEAVRAVWADLDAAWNARDVERFIRLFAEDATFALVARGQRLEGRRSLREHFARQFQRQSPELRHVTELHRIQHLDRGLATVDAEVRVRRVAGADEVEVAVLRTLAVFAIMSRHSGHWRIRGVRAYQLPGAAAADR